ncbi:RNA polymerase subunit sigma [Mycobacterium gordonae]|jgi:RNA polymerase sigma-B factor|uniref:SigB/SigF/SigG family RNA polymerase sigma factor n=1 Tax=Mycobacterium sp. 23 TaxID=3400424 RepID=UPI0007ED8B6B|nr:SigB/SigF/SigG family RNA polymerase sigma factor [Mycobacterium gordonae]OBJ81745.1 RNA polymerase subunit sigma [Mycobacterium gordonae]
MNEYADVAEMFDALNEMERGSRAYRRQRDLIVQRCLPLADHIARRYRGRGECLDDLVQVARLGLVNAVDRFDVARGAEFLAFAVPTITGLIRRHFRDCGWAVKVPRRIKDLHPQINAASQQLGQELGRCPNASEIADYLGVEREVVVDAMVAGINYEVLSLDVPRGHDNDSETAFRDMYGTVDSRYERVLSVQTARPLIAALPERERLVIKLRFFEEMTQSEIAERIGCSQMHVSRLLTQALQKVRDGAYQPDLAAVG